MRYQLKIYAEDNQRLETHSCDSTFADTTVMIQAFIRALLDEEVQEVCVIKLTEQNNEHLRQQAR